MQYIWNDPTEPSPEQLAIAGEYLEFSPLSHATLVPTEQEQLKEKLGEGNQNHH